MPQMKKDFQSKASIQRKFEETIPSINTGSPQYKKNNFFGGNNSKIPSHTVVSNGNGSSSGHHKDGDRRGTNTLSYSQTIGQHTISGVEKKYDASEVQTVFGTTFKANNIHHIDDNDELQESAHFGGQMEPTKEMLSSSPHYLKLSNPENLIEEEPEVAQSMIKSDFIDKKTIEEIHSSKVDKIPELKCNWFQFYTDMIYCAASSLILIINDVEYNVPFGLAKGLLAHQKNLETFISTTKFTKEGEVSVDAEFVEKIKGTRIEKNNFVSETSILVGDLHVDLV